MKKWPNTEQEIPLEVNYPLRVWQVQNPAIGLLGLKEQGLDWWTLNIQSVLYLRSLPRIPGSCRENSTTSEITYTEKVPENTKAINVAPCQVCTRIRYSVFRIPGCKSRLSNPMALALCSSNYVPIRQWWYNVACCSPKLNVLPALNKEDLRGRYKTNWSVTRVLIRCSWICIPMRVYRTLRLNRSNRIWIYCYNRH